MKEVDLQNLKAFLVKEHFSSFTSFVEFMKIENEVCKNNQHVDYKVYTSKIVELLKERHKYDWITYIQNRKLNIGVFTGSFNPFHKGHLNILEKAEQIFDKVIIGRGKHPDKNNHEYDLPDIIKNRQIETYDGLLTDFIDSLGYEVTMIRGLRNFMDFQYEFTMDSYYRDTKPDMKVVCIFADPKDINLSSSGIRMMSKYGKGDIYKI